MPFERSPFYVYRTGYHQDLLTLETLIWQDYANPQLAKRWSPPNLSTEEKDQYAYVDETSPFVLYQSNKIGGGVEVETVVGPSLKFELSQDSALCLTADVGRRITLKDPHGYLNGLLEGVDNVGRETLTKWLTAARNAYYFKGHWLRRPTVWMLTGLYEMHNGQYATQSSPSAKLGLGIDPMTIMAASGAPIGGSVFVKNDQSTALSGTALDIKVWAAQYQRLNVRYIQQADGQSAISTTMLELMPNVFSKGVMRSTDGGTDVNAVEILDGDAAEKADDVVPDMAELHLQQSALDEADAMFDRSLRDLDAWLSS